MSSDHLVDTSHTIKGMETLRDTIQHNTTQHTTHPHPHAHATGSDSACDVKCSPDSKLFGTSCTMSIPHPACTESCRRTSGMVGFVVVVSSECEVGVAWISQFGISFFLVFGGSRCFALLVGVLL